MARRKPYLNNRDLLKEIHKSKTTFCSFLELDYAEYDIILPNLEKINIRTVAQAKRNYANRIAKLQLKEHEKLYPTQKFKINDFLENWKKISKQKLIFRIKTFDHVPLDPTRKKTPKTIADHHVKLNFNPFQHWKFDENDKLIIVGKSHWEGGLENGWFNKAHGNITNELAKMYIKLCNRYASRGNWRGYCIDQNTEVLTKRGWLGIENITENDKILSYTNQYLKWSNIKSIYKNNFKGLMHKITTKTGIDMLLTPNHKLLTERGLIPVEYILESDRIILMGKPELNKIEKYSDYFVELIGWILTEGHYEIRHNKLSCICLWQNEGIYADRIRECLIKLNYTYSEKKSISGNIRFRIFKKDALEFIKSIPEKNLSMNLILSLSTKQRELLINTMINGDGWRTGHLKRYAQKNKKHIDLFQILCFLSGYRSNVKLKNIISFGKSTTIHIMNIFSERKNYTRGYCLNFHGGKNNGREHPGRGKINHPNKPTTYYNGRVWCPETEYGCFVARRNNTVYLTGNSYNDEMQAQGITQLTQVCLQFDESKSQNPFAYYTAIINAAFTRVLNLEKRGQNIRDDLLEINNFNPSFSRQNTNENEKYNNSNYTSEVRHIPIAEYLKMKKKEEG